MAYDIKKTKASMSLRSLEAGLNKARSEYEAVQRVARSRLGVKLYFECRRIVGENNKLLQAKDKFRLEKRRNFVLWRSNISNNHVTCGWIARDCEI